MEARFSQAHFVRLLHIGLETWDGANCAVRPGGLEVLLTGAVVTGALRGGTLKHLHEGGNPERWVGALPPRRAARAFGD